MFCRTDLRGPGSGNQKDAVTLVGLRASTTRLICFAIAAFALANLRIPGRPATLCPLRAITGVPCPFCGGTTAAVHLGRLDLLGALRANPVVVVGALVIVATPATIRVLATGHVEWLAPPTRRTVALAIGLALVFSECWQLVRFGIL
jgi:hypothetical protein